MRIVLAAGGTGGHIYPAISLGLFLQNQGYDVLLISSDNAISHEILDDINLPKQFYTLHGLSRDKSVKGMMSNVKTAKELVIVSRKVKKLLKEFNPQVCIGFGSYITYPVISEAHKLGIKTIIHEQNSYPGFVNRKLSKVVDYVCYSYHASLEFFDQTNPDKYVYTQNPRISEISPHPGGKYILVLGGSLGAECLNNLAQAIAPNVNQPVLLVSGSRYHIDTPVDNLIVKPYIADLLSVMQEASIVITRGGATTLLECCSMEKNTIVIPSPNVVANHQMLNAKELQDLGYLRLISENDVDPQKLLTLINTPFTPQPFKRIDANQKILGLIKELCD